MESRSIRCSRSSMWSGSTAAACVLLARSRSRRPAARAHVFECSDPPFPRHNRRWFDGRYDPERRTGLFHRSTFRSKPITTLRVMVAATAWQPPSRVTSGTFARHLISIKLTAVDPAAHLMRRVHCSAHRGSAFEQIPHRRLLPRAASPRSCMGSGRGTQRGVLSAVLAGASADLLLLFVMASLGRDVRGRGVQPIDRRAAAE